jgi:hypothetical protein
MRGVAVFWKVTKKTNIRVTTTNVRNVGGIGSRDDSESRKQTRQTSVVDKITSIGEKVLETINREKGEFEFGKYQLRLVCLFLIIPSIVQCADTAVNGYRNR